MKDGSLKASRVSMAQGHVVRAKPVRRAEPAIETEILVTAADLGESPVRPADEVILVPVAADVSPTVAERAAASERARRAPSSRPRRWPRSAPRRVLAAFLGVTLVAGGAYAATNWIVGLNGGSSGEGQSATVQNLTVSAVSSPAASNLLYPGGTGDVVLTISNPNPYPVTVTGVNLPTNTTYATGYTTATLLTTQTGCIATTPSDVIWNFSTSSSGSAHTLTSPLTVGASGNANNPLTVTLTNDASMTSAAPAACENTYFSMPALTGIAASGGAASVTSTPAVDAWTS